ncbi:MAG: AAA family ATPase [Methylovulum sp.]|nr:AAA family ATPase [Methylovulum sp.]
MSELSPEELLRLTRAAKKNLRYDRPLDPDTDQALLVDLNAARGNFSQDKLLFTLGVDETSGSLDEDNPQQYILFGGYRGCGKSTELRLLAKRLHQPHFYYVVLVDALQELDINNLNYSDILLAQAKVLMQQLDDSISVEPVFLQRLENWFKNHVKIDLSEQAFSGKPETGAKASTGLPLLANLFGSLTTAISIGSTHKEEIRTAVRNSFSEFAGAFNLLVSHIEERLRAANLGKKILFIVDGTDRLCGNDATTFFVSDIHQLKQINSNFIYCAPIDILTENGRISQEFSVFRLPMVKIAEKNTADYLPLPVEKLRDLIIKRLDGSSRLLADSTVVDQLIQMSGGHVRDLIRLLDYCLAETLGRKRIDHTVAEAAIRQLAADYRRVIKDGDYALLVEIDKQDKNYVPLSEQSRRLLTDSVLLEYNSYWWQSHPVVRTLPAYQQAVAAIEGPLAGGLAGVEQKTVFHDRIDQHFTRLEVRHYKKFRNLNISKIARINLFTGINNSGKTTLLEAIYLLSRQNDFAGLLEVIRRRGKVSEENLNSEWFLRQLPEAFELKGQFDGQEARVAMRHYEEASLDIDKSKYLLSVELTAYFADSDQKSLTRLFKGQDRQTKAGSIKLLCPAVFSSPFFLNEPHRYAAFYHKSTQSKALPKIFKFIQRDVVPGISDIRLVDEWQRFLVTDSAYDNTLDLMEYGEGLQRIFFISLLFASAQNGIVLIDEFENAIHVELIGKFCQFIHTLSIEFNVQVFLTSHSKECVDAFVENVPDIKDFAFHALVCQDNAIVAREFTGPEFKKLLDAGDVDLRRAR